MNLHEKHLFACYADNYSEKGITLGSALQGCQNWGITYCCRGGAFGEGLEEQLKWMRKMEVAYLGDFGPHPTNRQELMYQKQQVFFTAHTDFLPRASSAAHCDCALLRNAHA